MTPLMQEMLRCLNARDEVFTFGKTHRPEERKKLAAASERLHQFQTDFPATWKRLRRHLTGR